MNYESTISTSGCSQTSTSWKNYSMSLAPLHGARTFSQLHIFVEFEIKYMDLTTFFLPFFMCSPPSRSVQMAPNNLSPS